jgi:hypothetical protein
MSQLGTFKSSVIKDAYRLLKRLVKVADDAVECRRFEEVAADECGYTRIYGVAGNGPVRVGNLEVAILARREVRFASTYS